MKWTAEKHNHLIKLREKGLPWQRIAEEMVAKFGERFTAESCRSRWRTTRQALSDEIHAGYKEKFEIKSDGTHYKDALIEMSEEESKDPDYIMRKLGYNPNKWELINVKASVWHYRDKNSENPKHQYAIQARLKPKTNGIDLDRLLKVVQGVKPIEIKKEPLKPDKKLLEVSIYDPHFGITDYEYYKPTQAKIIDKIELGWEEVLFVIGQDMLHNDNMRGTTAKGTVIQQVDMVQAWEDASMFYEPMIKLALETSNNVKIIYSKGNHDESMSWAFVQYLKAKFPQAEFDDSFQERKIHTFGDIFIGFTHGDKARKELHNIFPAEFPLEWAKAKIKEIHIGHLHKEDMKDVYGTVIRTLSTKNKTDQWHKDNGFIGNNKRFMLFEYSTDELLSIHYV